MKKKLIVLFIFLFTSFLLWYLFIKPYDYLVRFDVKTYPGVVNQAIKAWSNKLENSKIISSDNIYQVQQEFTSTSANVSYVWKLIPKTDSTSSVKVYAKDLNNSFKNKIQIPFSETFFEKVTKAKLVDFNNMLKLHLDNFKVSAVSKDKLESSYVVYIPVKTTQQQKAYGMMANYPFLDNLMTSNLIKSNGRPFIEVTYWNKKNDSLHYNFCYPIIKADSLPKNPEIKYKLFKGGNMIKATYNGNYITSDRAWYKLLDYAKNKSIEVIEKPVEVFFSNPNYGSNELEWKADIYLPVKD